MIRRLVAALAAASALAPAGTPAQRPTFRARTDAVVVDVSVKKGQTPVKGLAATDFEILDNGVPQQIDGVMVADVPVDVTLAVDLSNSVVPDVNRFKADIQKFAATLRPTDGVRIVSFAFDVREDVPMQSPGQPLPLDRIKAGGATSLDDGLLYALLWPEPPDRRHLVIVFTDGYDSYSTVDAASIPIVVGHVPAVLHAVLVQPSIAPPPGSRGSLDMLEDAVRRSGGDLHPLSRATDDFQQIVDDFRASYALSYSPRGVPREGWHQLTVRVTRPDQLVVRARQGYGG